MLFAVAWENGNGRPRRVGRPHTIRLPVEDEQWVEAVLARTKDPRGFTGLVTEALRFYRARVEEKQSLIVEALDGVNGVSR